MTRIAPLLQGSSVGQQSHRLSQHYTVYRLCPNQRERSLVFSPPYCPLSRATTSLTQLGYAVLDRIAVEELIGPAQRDLSSLQASWNHLGPDAYLKDGGKYRKRRHSSLVLQDTNALTLAEHRAHWQPVEYNALHGGMYRWFEPVLPEILQSETWQALICGFAQLFPVQTRPWFIEAHQFRIDTEGGLGRPTPEGAHRDGVDFVVVLMVNRNKVKGGETRIFEADGPSGKRFTLDESWSALVLDDSRIIHETTPIQPLAESAYRDTLVITYRANGFMGEAP